MRYPTFHLRVPPFTFREPAKEGDSACLYPWHGTDTLPAGVTGYPSFMKPYTSVSVDLGDKPSKFNGSLSKVQQFLKNIGKKAFKNVPENKESSISMSDHEGRKLSERAHSLQDLAFAGGGGKLASTRKPLEFYTKDVVVPSSTSPSSVSGIQSQTSITSDADSDDRTFGDEGTLCCKLLISHLFFDAKRNDQMKTSWQAKIQSPRSIFDPTNGLFHKVVDRECPRD
ncbi:hypothetical protein CQW23_01916 [Capsicum baccatum]|uniref:Uncharacterized protein n=1 Tax=Capsicum baccatum TaxID=33114 RepID=A0A2G2XPX3_CAPBA|nr:hypothetical protein CQW23_01916 [Capsicum baccatum]